ncbi:MAG TPA: cytochrome c peroxidase [Burkholderiales bacterium]|nr:cytochrome c peroxidase [Burkholderiales bacterium]
MFTFRALFAGILLAAVVQAQTAFADEALRSEAAKLFGRIEAPSAKTLSGAEQELGRALFWDARLSLDGKTACANCHPAGDWGADRRRFSVDARGNLTARNSQTIFNAMMQPALRWTGDRKSGSHQAEGSMTGSMGFATAAAGLEQLNNLGYQDQFRVAYPDEATPLSLANYGRALEAYQATLVTPAAFDRFLAGKDDALTEQAKRGLRAFVSSGCASCHNGPLFGGTQFHKFGIARDYWLETKSEKIDLGRMGTSKKEEDRYVFRVPMLRNIARTAPYFHDGSVAKLDEAVRVMGVVQLGRTLEPAVIADIVAFLESLTGTIPPNYAPRGQAVKVEK